MARNWTGARASGRVPEWSETTLNGWRIGRVRGIPIEVNPSWILLFGLVTWDLARNVFPGLAFHGGSWVPWAVGVATSLLVFGSLLLHELAHSVVAIRTGIRVNRITLFVFGGVAQVEEEPRKATEELTIALAGPVASVLLALAFGGGYLLAARHPGLLVLEACLQRVALMNLGLAIFNMLPGFPLDGGRVLRAILWYSWGDALRATRVASVLGQGLGYALAGLGVIGGLLAGQVWIGVLNVGMGLVLASAARATYRHEQVKAALARTPVAELATPVGMSALVVDAATPLGSLVGLLMGPQAPRRAIVVSEGYLAGVLETASLGAVAPMGWDGTTVGSVMTPLTEAMVVLGRAPVGQALAQMASTGQDELLVLDDQGRLAGLLSAEAVRSVLEGPNVYITGRHSIAPLAGGW